MTTTLRTAFAVSGLALAAGLGAPTAASAQSLENSGLIDQRFSTGGEIRLQQEWAIASAQSVNEVSSAGDLRSSGMILQEATASQLTMSQERSLLSSQAVNSVRAGHAVTYWRQSERGRWERKA